jgi:hypothetical protein
VGLATAVSDAPWRIAATELFVSIEQHFSLLCRWLAEVMGSHPELQGIRFDLSVSVLFRPMGPLKKPRLHCQL